MVRIHTLGSFAFSPWLALAALGSPVLASAASALPAQSSQAASARAADPRAVPASTAPARGIAPHAEVARGASPHAPHATANVTHAAVGLREIATSAGAELVGGGPGYRARFDAHGLELTPALGADVQASHPLLLSLASIDRGAQRLVVGADVAPRHDGVAVVYERGAGIREQYELRRDGVELSFVLDVRPSGSGDLVARLHCATDLDVVPNMDGALAFELGSKRAIEIGAVTGIDARGVRVAGEARIDGDELVLSLPAAFVDAAAYPLTLDPLLGPSHELGGGADEHSPDIGFDSYSSRWLAVWTIEYSAADSEIRGQLLDFDGAPVGGLVPIAYGVPLARRSASVAGAGVFDAFVVAWQQSANQFGPFEVRCAVLDGQASGVLGELGLPNAGFTATDPDVGAGWTAADLAVPVVYRDGGVGIRAALVDITTGVPALANDVYVALDANAARPAISESGGNIGVYSVAWESGGDIHAALVDATGALVMSDTPLLTTSATELEADVDGFGNSFVVVFRRQLASSSEIGAVSAYFDATSQQLIVNGTPAVLASGAQLRRPCVAFDDTLAFVAWPASTGGGAYDVWLRQLSVLDGAVCAPATQIASAVSLAERPRMVARENGGVIDQDLVAVVWSEFEPTLPFDGSVFVRTIDTSGGPIADLGGGCGGGGTALAANQATLGNSGFQITLSGQDPGATLGLLNIAVPGAPTIGCGACVWIPFEFLLGKPIPPPSLYPYTLAELPIPCDLGLAGVAIDFQWTVLFTSATPCPLFDNISLSNAIEVTFAL